MPRGGSRVHPGFRAVAIGLLAIVLGPGGLAAQERVRRVVPRPHHPLVVVAKRDLHFGRMFRGTPSSVSPIENRAAQFEIEAGRDAQLQVSFILPAALVSTTAELLTVQFGPGDGIANLVGSPGGQVFDPTMPFVISVGEDDRMILRLGGTALPTATQPLGRYHGTVTVMVADLGI